MGNDDVKLLHIEVGPIAVDVPQTVGYFGGIAAAVALGWLEPPLAAFIAAVPLVKILADPGSPVPVRAVAEVLLGAAKPVGSDAEGTVRLAEPGKGCREVEGAERALQPARPGRPSRSR
jgi:hypothetical protein